MEDAPKIRDKYILVACNDREYLYVRDKLLKMGFKEFDDFIYHELYEKKICYLNMNCHALPTEYFLNHSPKFTDEYGIYPLMPAKGDGSSFTLTEDILSRIDLFLYQNMLPHNLYGYSFADEYTLSHIKKSCQVVNMPNFCPMGGGIFQTQTSRPIFYKGRDAFTQDVLIEEAYDECNVKDVRTILRYIQNYRQDPSEVRRKFDSSWERIINREKRWDIKISEYFMENYQKLPMVIDISHPSKYLMLEILERLMGLLGIEDEKSISEKRAVNFKRDFFIGTHGFVYPYVKRILNIEYEDEEVRKGWTDYISTAFLDFGDIKKHDKGISIERFIQEYIYVRKGVLMELRKGEGELSREQHVINCYRYILGREPESEDVVMAQTEFSSLEQLRNIFLSSEEFQRLYKKLRIKL